MRELRALMGVEARRLVLHPVVLAGVALSALIVGVGAGREGQLQAFLLMGVAVLPLALGTFVAANLAAQRSRRAGAEELLDTLPCGAATRTAAQLAALLATLPLALVLLAVAHLLFGAGDGLIISYDGARRVPAAVELAQGPLLVLALGAVGVLLGRVAPVSLLSAFIAVAIVFLEVPLAAWAPETSLRWAAPLVSDIVAVPDTWVPCEPTGPHMCGVVDHFDTTAMAWHLLALAGVAACAAAGALIARRSARIGLTLTAVAVVAATTVAAA